LRVSPGGFEVSIRTYCWSNCVASSGACAFKDDTEEVATMAEITATEDTENIDNGNRFFFMLRLFVRAVSARSRTKNSHLGSHHSTDRRGYGRHQQILFQARAVWPSDPADHEDREAHARHAADCRADWHYAAVQPFTNDGMAVVRKT
jgi:hypothetical protein